MISGRFSYAIRRIKRKKSYIYIYIYIYIYKRETEYVIKTEHISDKHTAKEKNRLTEVCWSAAL